MLSPLAAARAEYAWRLRQAHPDLERQLRDVYDIVNAVLDAAADGDAGLIEARARYVQCLRNEQSSQDEQLADLADLCAWLFRADLGCECPPERGCTIARGHDALQFHRSTAKALSRQVSDAPASFYRG
jgi:hypothetical protein